MPSNTLAGVAAMLAQGQPAKEAPRASRDQYGTIALDEHGDATVMLDGAEGYAPCTCMVGVHHGDRVMCHIVNHKIVVFANITVPSVNDAGYEHVKDIAEEANELLDGVAEAAASADKTLAEIISDADTANGLVSGMKQAADTAGTTLAQIVSDADSAASTLAGMEQAATAAHTTLNGIYQDAADAKTSANQANAYATNALDQLGVVQDVIGVLDYAAKHGTFSLTSDTAVQAGKVYFTYDSQTGDYAPVIDPQASALSTYYELTYSDDSMGDFIMTHLAVTQRGLWVLPSGMGQASDARYAPNYKVLLSSDGMYLYDGSGAQVVKYGQTIDFSTGRGFAIGDTTGTNYIAFVPGQGITIGGSVSIGSNKTLSQVLTSLDESIEQAAAAQKAVDDLEVGGRNLLLWTGEGESYAGHASADRAWGYTTIYGSVAVDGNTANFTKNGSGLTNNTSGLRIMAQASSGGGASAKPGESTDYNIDIAAGDTFTFSCDAKTSGDRVALSWQYYNGSSVWISTDISEFVPSDADWHRYAYTFTVPSNFVCLTALGIYCQLQGGVTLSVKNVKLERGNKPTDWTPAPEDVDTSISTAKTEAISTAAADATSKANSAKADAISTAASDATSKANAAKADAISTAAADATTKANAAKADAISTAAADATTKANAAAKTATNYITNVTSDGIWVTPEDAKPVNGAATSSTTGWHISDVLEYFKAGVSWIKLWAANSVAKLRLGLESSGHVVLDSTGMDVLTDASTSVAKFGAEGYRVGDESALHQVGDGTSLSFRNGNETVAYVSTDKFYSVNSEVEDAFYIGDYSIRSARDGKLVIGLRR